MTSIEFVVNNLPQTHQDLIDAVRRRCIKIIDQAVDDFRQDHHDAIVRRLIDITHKYFEKGL